MIHLETANELLRLGFCILPAHADRKMPTISWKKYQQKLPTTEELARMFPSSRCCIVCGRVSGNLEILDFDSQGVAFEPWLKQIPRPLIRRLFAEQTPSGGVHVVYRCSEPVEKNQKLASGADGKVLIETRGEGGLFLCSPSAGYVCTQGTWEAIPVLSPEDRQKLLDAARALDATQRNIPMPSMSPVSPSNLDTSELSPAEDFNTRGDVRLILVAHGWKRCQLHQDNEEWTRPGKTTGVSATLRRVDGIDVFYVFSSNAAPFEANKGYNPFQVYSLLQYDGDMSKAAETLLKEGTFGQQEIPDYDYLLETVSSSTMEDETVMEESEPMDLNPSETGSIPDDLYELHGFMGILFHDLLTTAPRRQPEFALAATLCAQSLLCHQKYCSPQGFRANIYCLISGQSGCGKDWGRYYLKELFTTLGQTESIRESYQSFPAIQNDLRYQYSPKLILWDEFGKAIQMMNLHTTAPHTKEIIPGLMKLYTSAHTWFTPSIKADIGDKKNKPDYSPIQNPFVTLLGTATPDQLLGNLSMELVSEGFLGRAFLFEAVTAPDLVPTIRRQALKISDIVLSEAIRQQSFPIEEWNPDQNSADSTKPPESRTVGLVPGAERILNDLLIRQTDHIQNSENGVLWARAEEQAEKLALLYAVSADPESPLIDENAALWGVRLAEHLTLKRIYLAQTWVSASDFDAKQKEVLRYVRSHGGEATREQLRHRFWKWNIKERNELFENLIETGQLKARKEKTGKRDKTVLYTGSKKNNNQQQKQQ